jgi:hypothetical protein
MSVLDRRYKEFRRMAKAELAHNRALASVSGGSAAVRQDDDEAADMFAAAAVWSRSDGAGQQLPEGMRGLLSKFLTA